MSANGTKIYRSQTAANHFGFRLNILKSDGHLCDVILITDDNTKFLVHKLILSASSKVFQAMFKKTTTQPITASTDNYNAKHVTPTTTTAIVPGNAPDAGELLVKLVNMALAGTPTIERIPLKGVYTIGLRELINFSYTQTATITTENVQALFETARLYEYKELHQPCVDFMIEHINCENCLKQYEFSTLHSIMDLGLFTISFIGQHLRHMMKNQIFLNLNADKLINLFQNPRLLVEQEEHAYEALLTWIRYDLRNRRKHVFDLMKLVFFSSIPSNYIRDKIRTEPLLRNEKCLDLVLCAYEKQFFVEHDVAIITCQKPGENEPGILVFYDFHKGIWCTKGTKLPTVRKNHHIVVLNNKVYMLGGVSEQNELILNVDVYDPFTNNWTLASPMLMSHVNFAVTVYDNKLHVIGSNTCNSGEIFNPDKNQWTEIPEMKINSSQFNCTVANKNIYVSAFINSVHELQMYDPLTKLWSHVYGGYNQRSMLHYRNLNNIHDPSLISNNAFFSIDHKIYIVTNLLEIHIFDIERNTWAVTKNKSSHSNCKKFKAVLYNDNIYTIPEFIDINRNVNVFSLNENDWQSLSSHFTVSSNNAAVIKVYKNNQF